jgi:hypothetical protein
MTKAIAWVVLAPSIAVILPLVDGTYFSAQVHVAEAIRYTPRASGFSASVWMGPAHKGQDDSHGEAAA